MAGGRVMDTLTLVQCRCCERFVPPALWIRGDNDDIALCAAEYLKALSEYDLSMDADRVEVA